MYNDRLSKSNLYRWWIPRIDGYHPTAKRPAKEHLQWEFPRHQRFDHLVKLFWMPPLLRYKKKDSALLLDTIELWNEFSAWNNDSEWVTSKAITIWKCLIFWITFNDLSQKKCTKIHKIKFEHRIIAKLNQNITRPQWKEANECNQEIFHGQHCSYWIDSTMPEELLIFIGMPWFLYTQLHWPLSFFDKIYSTT